MIRRIVVLAAPFVLSGTVAHAVTFTTPNVTVGADRTLECGVVNAGKTPTTVSLRWFDSFGSEFADNSSNCPLRSLEPLESCQITTPERNGTCVAESSSPNIRAAITVRNLGIEGASLIDVIPATR